jgi:phage tail-like protein
MMVHNFALIEVPASNPLAPLAFPLKTATSAIANGNFVGFSAMTVPEFTMETREIKQGNWPYVHVVPTGYQQGGQVTLTMAVMPLNVDMYQWWLQVVNGIFAPRRNLIMAHTRQDKALPARMLSCENCIPVAWKPASDFDANSTQVSLETITFHTQRINVIPVPISDIVGGHGLGSIGF